MRSACSTGAKSVVSPRPPTVSVGLSWLCSSGYARSSASSSCMSPSYSASEMIVVSRS